MATITQPGLYDLTNEQYRADPCPVPSLSSSVAQILLNQSPLHARFNHPRLNRERPASGPTLPMQKGAALHRLILGKGADIAALPFNDYRSRAAREARDEARQAGKIVLLEADYAAIRDCAEAARAQMEQREDCVALFSPGRAGAVMAWQEGETWCRGRVDYLPDDPHAPFFDLRGTTRSASPQEWANTLAREYRLQDRFQARGLAALRGTAPLPLRLVVVEMQAPYAVSVLTPAPDLQQCAAADMARALHLWHDCMATDHWPGYQHMASIKAPAWLVEEQEEM